MSQAAAMKYRLSVVSPLERRLREWGWAYGIRPAPDPGDEVEPEGETTLSRVAVDRTRERDVREEGWRPVPRVNLTRARIQQMIGPKCRVPGWAGGDPIRAPRQDNSGGSPAPVSKEADEVDDAVLALWRLDPRAALALKASYCLLGRRPLSERIAWVSRCSGTKVTRIGYRAALARGRIAVAATLKIDG